MTKQNQILIGAVVLAGLGFFAWKQMETDGKIGKKADIKAELPEVKAPEDVDKITVTNAEKGEVTFEKKGDKWELTKPVAYMGNQQQIKSLIDNMKELKVTEVIASNATEDMKKLYEFEPAKAVHVVASKGGEKKFDMTFGKSGSRGQMAMLGDKPVVYIATGYSSYLYTKETRQWRESEIIKFEDANAIQLAISNKAGEFSFTKGGDKWGGTFKGKPIERFDESKVGDAVRSIKGLMADDFADGKSAAETGMDAPEGTMTVTLKDNAGKYTIKVGKVATGTSRYAQKEGSPTTFVISSWPSEAATAEVSKFQFPADAGAKDAGKDKNPKLEMPGMPGMPQMPPGHPGHPGH
jgi:Domain of unknown function (DUF4340)